MFKRLTFLLCFISVALCIYDTRFLGNTTKLSLMVGEYKQLQLPISLEQYQSIDFKASPMQMQVCQIQDFDIEIEQKKFLAIGVFNTAIDVITSYDFLLQSIHIIDMVLFNKSMYFLYSDGIRRIDYNTKIQKFLPLPWLQRSFQKSLFIVNTTNQNLYLVDSRTLMRVKQQTFEVIRGYFQLKQLTSACFMNSSIIAVLDKYQGVTLYNIDRLDAIFVFNFRKQHFGWDIEFVDIVSHNNKTLLILDKKKGVVNLTLDDEQISRSDGVLIKKLNRDCSKLKLNGDILYVVCTELNQINLLNLSHKQYQHPSFRIKDILIIDNKPMIVGNNIIKVYNGNFQIDSHLDAIINRIITVGNSFIVGNKRGIKTVEWKIKQPTIECGIKRDTVNPPEEAHLLLQVVAKCNKTYFEEYNVSYDGVQEELCLYHFPVEFEFWVGKQIDFTALKIASIVIFTVLVSLGLVWIFFRRKIGKLRGYLMNYNFVEDNTTTDINVNKGYDKFQDEKTDEKDKVEDNGQQRSSKAESELHDIGE